MIVTNHWFDKLMFMSHMFHITSCFCRSLLFFNDALCPVPLLIFSLELPFPPVIHLHGFCSFTASTLLFSTYLLPFCFFSHSFEIFLLVLIGFFSCFFIRPALCRVLCGFMCHQPVLGHPACSGRLSLVSGSGHCPPRPSSPWQVAQEHFLGRYRPTHV